MRKQTPDQIGVCSWSTKAGSATELVGIMKQLGLTKVHLALNPIAVGDDNWIDSDRILADAGIEIVCGMFGTVGEDYSTLESIKRTGGVVPDETWEQNWQIVQNVAKVSGSMNLTQTSCHAGFLPEDKDDPNYAKLIDRLRQCADCFARYNCDLLFETGQETAENLAAFLDNLERDNIAANFDPANMILYAKGDPVESVRKLMPRIGQVHLKDAVTTRTPGTWGEEVPLGEGDVDWPGFFAALAEGDYAGDLIIEREAGNDRIADIEKAIEVARSNM